MIYINGNSDLQTLLPLFQSVDKDATIDIWNGVDELVEKMRQWVFTILINPWGYIQKDINGELTHESNGLIAFIRTKMCAGACVIFWGPWDVDIFWNSVIIKPFNRDSFQKIIASLKPRE